MYLLRPFATLAISALLLGGVNADFQLACGPCCDEGGDFSHGCYPDSVAIAQNAINCGNMGNPGQGWSAQINDGNFGGALGCNQPTEFIQIAELCGVNAINLYSDGQGNYQGFVNNGDGTQVATCYPGHGGKDCDYGAASCSWSFAYYCYSDICT
jgi:hypothetical protein